MAMISTRRGIIIGLVVGSLIGGTAGATILTASEHGGATAALQAPAGQPAEQHATADHGSSSTT
jgi:hypothetical protein